MWSLHNLKNRIAIILKREAVLFIIKICLQFKYSTKLKKVYKVKLFYLELQKLVKYRSEINTKKSKIKAIIEAFTAKIIS